MLEREVDQKTNLQLQPNNKQHIYQIINNAVNKHLPQKQTISHVFNPCCIGCGIIKSDRVSNLFAQLIVTFLSYTLCYCHRCNSSRLSDANDFTILTKPTIVQKLWQLCIQQQKKNLQQKEVE
jgi:hypothetical protein